MTTEESFLRLETRKLWHRRFISAMVSLGVLGIAGITGMVVKSSEAIAVVSTKLDSAQLDRSRDSAVASAGLAQAAAERTRMMLRTDGIEARIFTLEGYHRADPGDPSKAGKYIRK